MVLPLIFAAIVVYIIYLAVTYWYITIPLIVIIAVLWHYTTRDSEKKPEENYQSRRDQSSSYQNYSQSDNSNYNSNYDSNNNSNYDSNKQSTNDYSYRKSKSKSKKSQAKAKRVNDRLEKFHITPSEAQIIFGKYWRSKLGKPEWEFYYVVRYIEIDVEFDYNNRQRKKFGYLYSKVLEIIRIVMEENADTREDEERQWNGYSKYDDYDYNYENNWDSSEINEEDIVEAFDIFGLTRESTKDQIKTKYRELTLRFHPDKNKSVNATTKMTEINNAYEIIMGAIA
jgi:hypothetical protein